MIDDVKTIEMNKIHLELLKNLDNYRKSMSFMACDAPIGVLCLPKVLENILIRNDCLRIYDLLNRDLTKIKGLGKTRLDRLTACLDQFISIC